MFDIGHIFVYDIDSTADGLLRSFQSQGENMMKKKLTATLLALTTAAFSLSAAAGIHAAAAGGAGGFVWEKTSGYQEGTDSVTDENDQTTVKFTDADNGDNIAGFCTQNGAGWDWSDYTQLSFTLTNDSASDISFSLALGTGAEWSWYQAASNSTVEAGKSLQLTYYLNAEEWAFNGTEVPSLPADLFAVHRINMMVMPASGASAVSGSVTVSDLELSGSSSASVEPKNGFYVDGSVLRDANQNPFIMRGTNYAYTWYSWDGLTEAALKEIAGYGANVVRIVLGDGDQFTKNTAGEIANLIQLCEKNKLVAVFEVHDATGKDETQPLLNAANYFAKDIASALKGHEDTVIINIANEWQGSAGDTAWQSAYIQAVKVIRDAGLKHCIMCDAGGWGQSASTVINGGAAVLAADPEKNTMFSVHMYGYAGGSQSMIKNIMDSMLTRQLCLVIGEFGYKHSDGDVDEGFIMEYAQQKNIGWMAWSWYGNGSPVEYLDMSSANAGGKLSADWGNVIINGKNGWKETAKPCSVFTGGKPQTTTSVSVTTTATTSTTVSATVSATVSSTTTATTTTTFMTSTGKSETTTAPKDIFAGDVNESGNVDISDAVLLARLVAEDANAKVSAEGLLNADVNKNGAPDSEDVIMILKYVVKLLPNLQ